MAKVPQDLEAVRKSGTSPQVRNQSASLEPVRNQSGKATMQRPNVGHPPKKTSKCVHVILATRSGRPVRKLVRKWFSRLVHRFADYDQSADVVFPTSVP